MERSRRSALLLLVFAALVLASSSTAQEAASLFDSVQSACEEAQTALERRVAMPLEAPEECTPTEDESTGEAASCLTAVRTQVQRAVAESVEEVFPGIRSKLMEAMDGRSFQETRTLYQQLENALEQLATGAQASANLTLDSEVADLDPRKVQAHNAAEVAKSTMGKAIDGFERRCRQELFDELGPTIELIQLRQSSEDQYLASLNKQDGFSRVVRCQWVRGSEEIDHLDCNPDLEVSGHDISVIEILPPAKAPDFRLAWVQAISAEESPGYKPARGLGLTQERVIMACPSASEGEWKRQSLACDELCFRSSGDYCPFEARRAPLVSRTAQIAVHLPRQLNTTYGCPWGRSIKCAARKLRGHGPGEPERAKLSLVTRGSSPIIHIRAIDSEGNLAEGHVLVGYERWRVESGGFLGISWNALDHELVTEPAEANDAGGGDGMGDDGGMDNPPETATQVMVSDIRDADDYSQETGVFVNLIPRNYEWLGLSLGFATSDGSAPSVYFGPTIRLTTFGNRGVAAFSIGAVMKQVDRFPGVQIGDTYAGDSSLLQPDERFTIDGYFALQLGFSFGPIGAPDEGDD